MSDDVPEPKRWIPGGDGTPQPRPPVATEPEATAPHTAPEPFSELSQFVIDPTSVQRLGDGFCRKKHVVILGAVDPDSHDPVTVGMLDPEDRELRRLLQGFLHRPIDAVRLNAYEINKAIDIGYGRWQEPAGGPSLELSPTPTVGFEPDRAAQALLDDLLAQAITLGASDVHVERYGDDVDVRVRVDGMLRQLATPLSHDNVDGVLSRLKVLADLDIAERRAAQDGRITTRFGPPGQLRPIDFRISIVPGPDGEDAVLRLLDRATQLMDLAALGLEPDVLPTMELLAGSPEGMLLVTGPTGSGKTTTLYSMLDTINEVTNKVLTVEDPIEYRFEKINQKQVGPRMGFADYARAFLRQDPDVLMIGEIRDEATAQAAGRAAQTGHMVLSTLHTGDAVGAIARLRSLGQAPEQVAETLLGVVAQRLVRRLCVECREVAPEDATSEAAFARQGRRFAHAHGRGCERCGGTGFAGRVGIFEVLAVDPALADSIADGINPQHLRTHARRAGMRTLYEAALRRVERGETSFAELRRCVPLRLRTEPALSPSGPPASG